MAKIKNVVAEITDDVFETDPEDHANRDRPEAACSG